MFFDLNHENSNPDVYYDVGDNFGCGSVQELLQQVNSSVDISISYCDKKNLPHNNECYGVSEFENFPEKSYVVVDDFTKSKILLNSFKILPDDWDGCGANAPDLNACLAAGNLLEKISLIPNVPAPSPMLVEDGEVALFWKDRTKEIYAEIGTCGENCYYYYIKNGDRRIRDDNLQIENQLDPALVGGLKAAFDAA